jgi:hypothetical protein
MTVFFDQVHRSRPSSRRGVLAARTLAGAIVTAPIVHGTPADMLAWIPEMDFDGDQ